MKTAIAALTTCLTFTPTSLGMLATSDAATPLPVIKRANTLADARAYAQRATRSSTDWRCLSALWDRESGKGWDPKADNPRSSAFGIAQLLHEKSTDPVVQVQHGWRYIQQRYGTACKALQHSLQHGWY